MATSSRTNEKGEFNLVSSSFREFVTPGGRHPPGSNRYHLYVSLACPFAHRTLITRALKGLEGAISVDVLDWERGEEGWKFNPDRTDCTADSVNGFSLLREVYLQSEEGYSGKISVPVLYDKMIRRIVNNESSEIVRMLNNEFNEFATCPEVDLYPLELRDKIEVVNEMVYEGVNIAVYKCGFATTQKAYDESVLLLFNTLLKLEGLLSEQRYLCGDRITEADVRLCTSLLRFDVVYVQHFKCNLKMIRDYPNLFGYLRELYQIPEVKLTVDFEQIKKHYVFTHKDINKYSIVPIGPELDLNGPHGRDKFQV